MKKIWYKIVYFVLGIVVYMIVSDWVNYATRQIVAKEQKLPKNIKQFAKKFFADISINSPMMPVLMPIMSLIVWRFTKK